MPPVTGAATAATPVAGRHVQLTSFPETNPNPVAELDAADLPVYLNPAAQALFTGAGGTARQQIFFADIATLRVQLQAPGASAVERELCLGASWFRQQWYCGQAPGHIRVYATDITALKDACAALQQAYTGLEMKVAERTAQLLDSNLRLKLEIIKRQTKERQSQISNDILKLATRTISRQHYLEQVSGLLAELAGCRCVGLRLFTVNRDIHAEAYCGFDRDFATQNNCRQQQQDCGACIRLFAEATASSGSAQLTGYGSFVCNDTTVMVAGFPSQLQAEYRRCCLAENFLTVALVPVIFHERGIGMLYLADERPQRLPVESLQLIESLMNLLGEVVNRFTLIEIMRENSERLEKLFANTLFAVVYLDRQFNYLRVNRAYAAIDQQSPAYYVGKNHFVLYPHAEEQALFQRVLDTGEPATILAKPLTHPRHPPTVTYWDWGIHPIKDAAGQVEGLTFCMVDVTKRKVAEYALQKTQAELLAQLRLSDIGTLAATVAHELRNPLAAIKMATANIKRKAADPKLERHLANIDKKLTESESIIDNLLYYARIKQPRLAAVNPHALLGECLAAIRERLPAAAVELRAAIEPLRDCIIFADELQLRELFTNLLNNAHDALIDGRGVIELSAERGPQTITIRVRDTGTGIDPADLPRVFDAFYTTKAKGTGLGLTVCHQVAINHQGTITISGEPHQGTTVTVVLPRAVTEPCAS